MHVLSLPPAFVLSQDQTLKLNEILLPTGHFNRASRPHRILDEFQTHPPQSARPSPPHGVPAQAPQRRDEFLKRDRQLSLFKTPPPDPPSAQRQPQIQRQSPARTPPPTSLFLPMQLSNSRSRAPGLAALKLDFREDDSASGSVNSSYSELTSKLAGTRRPKHPTPASQRVGGSIVRI